MHYSCILLTYTCTLLCCIYCSDVPYPPTALHNIWEHHLLLRLVFTTFVLSHHSPLPPAHGFSLHKLKRRTCVEWQEDFQGQLSAVPRHCRNHQGEVWNNDMFSNWKNRARPTNRNVLSRKMKLFSRQWLALLRNTHQGTLTQKSKGEEKVETLPVRQRHISGPSPEGIQACQRGEQPGLLQKERKYIYRCCITTQHTPMQIYLLITLATEEHKGWSGISLKCCTSPG